jgi:hypothetical protein
LLNSIGGNAGIGSGTKVELSSALVFVSLSKHFEQGIFSTGRGAASSTGCTTTLESSKFFILSFAEKSFFHTGSHGVEPTFHFSSPND